MFDRLKFSIVQILVALDQLGNALLLGYADESISSRAWRRAPNSTGWKITQQCIDSLFFWQDEHCYKAFSAERLRSQLPPALRDKET